MSAIKFIGVLIGSYVVGAFGFAQIIGSLQNVKARGIGLTLFTTILWAAILVGAYFLMNRFIPSERISFFIGMGVSLVMILRSGKIQ